MDNRRMLELAALAAGIEIKTVIGDTFWTPDGITWDPLTYDADAFRLAATLLINIGFIKSSYSVPHAFAKTAGGDVFFEIEENHESLEAAARLAIVRCAAEIGKRVEGL